MTQAELVDYYLEKKLNGELDLTQIKKALREEHDVSSEDVSAIADIIAQEELKSVKSNTNKNTTFLFFSLAVGVLAIIYAAYAILNPMITNTPQLRSSTLNYLCLAGGIYIVFRNIKRLRS